MKIGIISSFNILCGNATYSMAIANALKDNLDKEDGEIIQIDIPTRLRHKQEDKIINEITSKIQQCDACNLQFELGLYGTTPTKAVKNLKSIIKSMKKGSITMHRIDTANVPLLRDLYRKFKGKQFGLIRSIQSGLVEWYKSYTLTKAYKSVIKCAYENKLTFIVHTEREKKRLKLIYDDLKVELHPIMWPEYRSTKIDEYRKQFLNKNLPVVGLFGFVSEYKNYDIVIDLMKSERNLINLLICGGAHPESSEYGKKGGYIDSLDKKIDNMKSVVWKTGVSDEELVSYMRSVDLCIIPYFETGQSGSGIVSLAIQNSNKTILSDTGVAFMIQPYLDQSLILFDVASLTNLKTSIQSALANEDYNPRFKSSFSEMINLYVSTLR